MVCSIERERGEGIGLNIDYSILMLNNVSVEGVPSVFNQTLPFSGQRDGAPSHPMMPFHAGNN